MVDFPKLRAFLIYFLVITLLAPLFACYKPAYLQKSQKTEVAERWRVKDIDPTRLSAEEKIVFAAMGPPTFIRFFRKLSPEREGVYEWVYTDPVRLVYFADGKQLEYVVMDEDLSRLNYQERKARLYVTITTAVVAGLGLVGYLVYDRWIKK